MTLIHIHKQAKDSSLIHIYIPLETIANETVALESGRRMNTLQFRYSRAGR